MNTDKLKGKMTEKKITQCKMAKELNITPQALNAKINGRSQFCLDEVVKITMILNIKDPREIFFENNIPYMQRPYNHSTRQQ